MNRIIVAAIVTMGVLAVIPAEVFAAGSIGGRPGLPREDEPRTQSIFLHTLDIGETAKDKVLISNRSDKKQTVELHAVDAITTNTGSFTCKQNIEKKTGVGGWVKLAKNEVTLAPDESELIDFTVTVPKKSDVGEHNACIVFASKDDVEEVGNSLRIRTRSAVRLAITVPGDLKRGVSIQDFSVSQDKGIQQFTVQMRNTGNISADTDVKIKLRSLFGTVAYENGGQYPVLPGNSLEIGYRNENTPFWGGWYKADATITYDKDAKKWGTNSAPTLETDEADSVTVFIAPQPLALVVYILLLVGAIGAAAYWWFQKRKVQLILNSWQRHIVKEGETLEGIAKERKVNWRLVAKINKLEAPYTLTPGKRLLVPRGEIKQPSNR